ncbi:MAG: hypothetical protein AAF512_05895 [Pseudomonadota bacterium]
MEEIYKNLFSIQRTSFLLVRQDGNFLLGSKRDISDDFEAIASKGPVTKILLGDRHHGIEMTSRMAEYFNASICCSAQEAKVLKKRGIQVSEVIEHKQHYLAENLQAIPTPGHTQGALSYLWETAGQKILFIGDTIVPIDGEWEVWVTKPNRHIMRSTMVMLEKLQFDFIASNSFAATGEVLIPMTPEVKQHLITSVLEKIAA